MKLPNSVISFSETALHPRAQSIPFNRPCMQWAEIANIFCALQMGKLAGGGAFSRRCEAMLAERVAAPKVLLTSSCTDALEMASLLMDIQPGDEVIMPSFTFVSTANAFCLRGARPVFADIREEDLNLDASTLEKYITPRTKGIVPVHYGGQACDMDSIMQTARAHSLWVVEDAAQALFSTYKGKPLGSFGDVGCFSFHETKTIMCGEGGAIAINSKNLIQRSEIIHEKGTNRSQFFRGEVDKYTWVDMGSSYLPSDMTAAFLYGQLTSGSDIIAKRRRIHEIYEQGLQTLEDAGKLRIFHVRPECGINYHLYYILTQDTAIQQDLLAYLKQRHITAVTHYVPLHTSPYAQKHGYTAHLPVTEDIAKRLIRLPFYNDLGIYEQEYIIHCIHNYFK